MVGFDRASLIFIKQLCKCGKSFSNTNFHKDHVRHESMYFSLEYGLQNEPPT